MIKGIFLFFFSLLLFLGNVGIPVFTHACKEDGMFRSFIFNTTNHCEEINADLPPCCKDEKEKKDDCCNDETQIIKLKLDYSNQFNHFHFDDFEFESISNPVQFSFVYKDYLTQFVTNKGKDPPPKPWGKTLLIQHQTFRI